MPKVLNIRDIKETGDFWTLNTVRIDGLSSWGNPFIIGVNGDRDTVCDSYLDWLTQWIKNKRVLEMTVHNREYSNKWVVENLSQLRGKNLACWCSPLRCHGDTLVALANVR